MTEERAQHSKIRTEFVTLGEVSRLNKLAFVLLCALPVIATVLFGGVDNATWLLVTLIAAGMTFLWLAESWRGGGFLINSSSLQLPLIGLVLIGLIQIVPLGSYELEGLTAFRTLSMDAFATKMFLTRLIVYLIFFAACLVLINSEKRIRTTVLLIVIFGAAMAFFGIMQRLSDPDGIYGMRATPQAIPFGPFVNQHHFAAFMEMTGGLTLSLLFGRRTGRDRKILLGFALVLMGSAIVLTGSRGGLLGMLSVGAFAAVLSLMGRNSEKRPDEPNARVGFVLLGVALTLMTLGVALFVGGGDSLLRGVGAGELSGDFSSGRLHFWPIALKIFLAHPLLGAGFDAFGVAFTRYDTWNGTFRVEQAHNDFLQILAEAGIAGSACLTAFIYLLFKKGLSLYRASHGFRREAAIGALAGCFGILVHSFFDFPLRTPSNAFFFLLLCTVATVTVATSRKTKTTTEP